MSLILTKHHGLGNDFLVLLDFAGRHAAEGEAMARALCHRRRGVGADGFIRVSAGGDGADVAMELRNADGGRAEMSGNGIRCVGQAVVDAGVHGGFEMAVRTDAGLRHLLVHPEHSRGRRNVEVEMGPVKVETLPAGPGARSAYVDVGNPHLVVLDDGGVDLEALAMRHRDRNVELITVRGVEIDLRVWERGVGRTDACGTGSCAAAGAARAWGLTGDEVLVHNPGGDLAVRLDGEEAMLTGPTDFIARIEVPWPS